MRCSNRTKTSVILPLSPSIDVHYLFSVRYFRSSASAVRHTLEQRKTCASIAGIRDAITEGFGPVFLYVHLLYLFQISLHEAVHQIFYQWVIQKLLDIFRPWLWGNGNIGRWYRIRNRWCRCFLRLNWLRLGCVTHRHIHWCIRYCAV